MLEIRNISKTFDIGGVNEKRVFSDFSMNVSEGEFVTIIGSNGACKSTLFNAISGVFKVDAGSILLDGIDITHMKEHIRSRFIGRMFQNPMMGTAPEMSIEENLYLASDRSKWFGTINSSARNEFRERLAMLEMGLEDRLKSPVGLLSGGQRQALTLLMATYKRPKLLLLDEHTAALDPATAEKVLDITEKIVNGNRITCLMITHNMQSALKTGSRTVMMDNGRIVYDVSGTEREKVTVAKLLECFRSRVGRSLNNDRMML